MALSAHPARRDPPTADGPLVLTGDSLTLEDVVAVARDGRPVRLGDDARVAVRAARDTVDRVMARGEPVYGLNTGLGALSRHTVSAEELDRFSFATVADRTAADGQALPRDVVRAMMVVRANGLAKAAAGVRVELIDLLVDLLNAGVHPVVRELASVGQSDLSELADIGKVLIGRGEAEFGGRTLPGATALAAAGLRPIALAPKEALALISANALSLGHGSLFLHDAATLVASLQAAAALSLEGFAANLSTLHPAVASMRPHPGQRAATGFFVRLLEGSYLWEEGAARNLQDPLSFRCLPQAHGTLRDALAYARQIVGVELNSGGDNPLVSVEDDRIVSNGNFDGSALALAFDMLRIALAGNLKMAAERVQKLLWGHFSGLSTYLGAGDGASGGLRTIGRRCAALAAEARSLAHPVSLDYGAQLAEGIEDEANMAPLALRRASALVSLGHRMVAQELIAAAEAVDRRQAPRLGRGTAAAYAMVRTCVPPLVDETEWRPDVAALVHLVAEGRLAARAVSEA